MFETKSTKEVLNELNVDRKHGLSKDEVNERLTKYGPNKLSEKKKAPLILVFFLTSKTDDIYFMAAAFMSLAISLFNVIQLLANILSLLMPLLSWVLFS